MSNDPTAEVTPSETPAALDVIDLDTLTTAVEKAIPDVRATRSEEQGWVVFSLPGDLLTYVRVHALGHVDTSWLNEPRFRQLVRTVLDEMDRQEGL